MCLTKNRTTRRFYSPVLSSSFPVLSQQVYPTSYNHVKYLAKPVLLCLIWKKRKGYKNSQIIKIIKYIHTDDKENSPSSGSGKKVV